MNKSDHHLPRRVLLLGISLLILHVYLYYYCNGLNGDDDYQVTSTFSPSFPFKFANNTLPKSPLVVYTQNGCIHGNYDSTYPNTRQFLGIPYADPPVGPLRWSKPRPSQLKWDNNTCLLAHQYSAACIQFEFYLNQSEDCLYLNIFTPSVRRLAQLKQHRPDGIPVMIYFFGGGFFLGTGSEHKIYDGSPVAEENDIIIVTFNYRVGPLGFLVGDFDRGGHGNYGLHDQSMVIQWVRENIGAFGGDSNDITLWGQSAGAFSVLAQITSSQSFLKSVKRAILQSPPAGLMFKSKQVAMKIGRSFMRRLGCRTESCLRQKSALEISKAQITTDIKWFPGSSISNLLHWFPSIDGDIIKSQFDEKSVGAIPKTMEIIMGTTDDELSIISWILERIRNVGKFVTSKLMFKSVFNQPLPLSAHMFTYPVFVEMVFGIEKGRQILSRYPKSKLETRPDLFYTLLTDLIFTCPTLKLARSASSKNLIFNYKFQFQPDFLRLLGGSCGHNRVCHAVDIPYFFRSYSHFITFTPRETKLSDWISHFMFKQFVERKRMSLLEGKEDYVDIDGEISTIPRWPRHPAIMLMNDTWSVVDDDNFEWSEHDCDFLTRILSEY